MVEMTAVSNATGLKKCVACMVSLQYRGPENCFQPQVPGGILETEGVVDYAIGNVSRVFVGDY